MPRIMCHNVVKLSVVKVKIYLVTYLLTYLCPAPLMSKSTGNVNTLRKIKRLF
jgi:hypothetical protein